jgi:hypothetical protein
LHFFSDEHALRFDLHLEVFSLYLMNVKFLIVIAIFFVGVVVAGVVVIGSCFVRIGVVLRVSRFAFVVSFVTGGCQNRLGFGKQLASG